MVISCVKNGFVVKRYDTISFKELTLLYLAAISKQYLSKYYKVLKYYYSSIFQSMTSKILYDYTVKKIL